VRSSTKGREQPNPIMMAGRRSQLLISAEAVGGELTRWGGD
jgi:hypothetical protein